MAITRYAIRISVMAKQGNNTQIEENTLRAMIEIYCNGNHDTIPDKLCDNCTKLLDYAITRLKHCTLLPNKPPCSKCPIHCYKPKMREQVKQVMRYAGPKTLKKHPILATIHLIK